MNVAHFAASYVRLLRPTRSGAVLVLLKDDGA
jgi:hypothetical protein